MNTLGFECVHCHNRLSVSADWAGKAVRCPKCQLVIVAPAEDQAKPAPPPPPVVVATNPMVVRPKPTAIEADSIFSDPDEGESVIGGLVDTRRPVMPQSASDFDQPTVRVPGIPDPTPPVRQTLETRASIDLFAGASTVVNSPAEVTNPFRKMVDEVLSEAEAQDAMDEQDPVTPLESQVEIQLPTSSSNRLKWALIGVSIYAVAMTVVAALGWTRTPTPTTTPEKAVPHVTKKA